MSKINSYTISSFMSNVDKCDKFVHRQTHSELFGTVKLVKAAYENGGKRKFSLSNSPVAKSGSYSFAGLRRAFESAIGRDSASGEEFGHLEFWVPEFVFLGV